MGEIVGATARKSRGDGGSSLREAVRFATAGRFDEAQASFERLLALDPENAEICNGLGQLLVQRGNLDAGVEMLDRAFKLTPFNAEIRRNCFRAHFMRANALWARDQHEESIEAFRRALRFDPANITVRTCLIDALGRIGGRAQRGDFVPDPAAPAGNHLLIACMPKSGSSFLTEALVRLTSWMSVALSYAYFQNEQDLYPPNIVAVDRLNTVTQQHCRATVANVQILQGFAVRPIVLVRNLADIVMSLVDFYDGGAVVNTFFAGDWLTLEADAKRDLIVDHVMPWYVSFYASWRHVAASNRLDCLFVRYENMIADKAATLARVAEFLGLGKTTEACGAAIATAEGDRTKIRFNRGIAGRGAQALSAEQMSRLRRLAASYRSVDFSPVGL